MKNKWGDDFGEVNFRYGSDGGTVMFAHLLTRIDLN